MQDLEKYTQKTLSFLDETIKKIKQVEDGLANVVSEEDKGYVFFRLKPKVQEWLNSIESTLDEVLLEYNKTADEIKSYHTLEERLNEHLEKIKPVEKLLGECRLKLDAAYKIFADVYYDYELEYIMARVNKNYDSKFEHVSNMSSTLFNNTNKTNLINKDVVDLKKLISTIEANLKDFIEYVEDNFVPIDFVEKVDEKFKLLLDKVNSIKQYKLK